MLQINIFHSSIAQVYPELLYFTTIIHLLTFDELYTSSNSSLHKFSSRPWHIFVSQLRLQYVFPPSDIFVPLCRWNIFCLEFNWFILFPHALSTNDPQFFLLLRQHPVQAYYIGLLMCRFYEGAYSTLAYYSMLPFHENVYYRSLAPVISYWFLDSPSDSISSLVTVTCLPSKRSEIGHGDHMGFRTWIGGRLWQVFEVMFHLNLLSFTNSSIFSFPSCLGW